MISVLNNVGYGAYDYQAFARYAVAMIRITIFLLSFYVFTFSAWGQVSLEFVQPTVTKENATLAHAFAGGINSAQYQTMDLDSDNDLDLVLFDRSSDKINCFENTGQAYVYQPAFNYLFPPSIQHWMVLADYDCDGRKDLFTYTGQGIRVFRNTQTNGSLQWELVVEPLKTQGSSSAINLLLNPTDIPAIADLDGDNDLDILIFDFASSFQIEFHQNHAIENTGNCGLEFVRETRTYGDIRDCGCDNFTVSVPCGSSGRIQHAGGKAILAMDYNMDGNQDLVLSQEACTNLNLATHTGAGGDATFNPFDNSFPTFDSPIGFVSFPAVFFEDVTFDGHKDLLVSSNERSNGSQMINFGASSFVYPNEGGGTANVFTSSASFLQHEMIDAGEFAYPALTDINGDGDNDLVLGNGGSLVDGEYISRLAYYRSTATGLVWQTDDLFELSALQLTYIKPQFIDINNDQRKDLVFSARNSSNAPGLYYLLNEGDTGLSFNLTQLRTIDLTFTILDDFHLDDVNEDGLPDLLLGLSTGQLDYYRNTGSAGTPAFTLQSEEFLGIGPSSDLSNLSLTTGDLTGNGTIGLITTDRSGQTQWYEDYRSGNANASALVVSTEAGANPESSRWGRVTKPVAGSLLGRNVVVIGSIQGGVRLLATSQGSGETALTLQAYPVPSSMDGQVSFLTNRSNTILEVFTMSGQKVAQVYLTAFQSATLNLSHLEAGLYLAKASNNGQHCTSKIILGALP